MSKINKGDFDSELEPLEEGSLLGSICYRIGEQKVLTGKSALEALQKRKANKADTIRLRQQKEMAQLALAKEADCALTVEEKEAAKDVLAKSISDLCDRALNEVPMFCFVNLADIRRYYPQFDCVWVKNSSKLKVIIEGLIRFLPQEGVFCCVWPVDADLV